MLKLQSLALPKNLESKDKFVERHDGGRRAKIILMPSLPNMHYKKIPTLATHTGLRRLTQPHATKLALSVSTHTHHWSGGANTANRYLG